MSDNNTSVVVARSIQLTLAATGFTLGLHFIPPATAAYHNPRHLGAASLCSTVLQDAVALHTEVDGSLGDLGRLCSWMEEHVVALVEDQSHNSKTWVPQYLDLSVQCLGGYVERTEDTLSGDFTIRVMARVGRDASGTAVYAGFEGVIEVQEALNFCTALRAYTLQWVVTE